METLQQKYNRPIRPEVSVKRGFMGGAQVEIGADVWVASPSVECVSIKSARHQGGEEESSLIARLFEHERNRATETPAARQNRGEPERSMPLGKAVVAPPIPALECYEGLQSNLWVRFPAAAIKVMLLVGADRGCGVSTAAANLAASLAKNSCARVLLVDANVRLENRGMSVASGAAAHGTEVSLSRLLTEAPILQEPPPGPSNLYVLPNGRPCALSLSDFQSAAMEELFRNAREFFEYTIIDAPFIPQHPESLLLIRKVDGVILVVESEKTRKQSASWAKRQIEKTGVPLLGVILNRRKYRVPTWLYKRT